jgi:hypothetical protein
MQGIRVHNLLPIYPCFLTNLQDFHGVLNACKKLIFGLDSRARNLEKKGGFEWFLHLLGVMDLRTKELQLHVGLELGLIEFWYMVVMLKRERGRS